MQKLRIRLLEQRKKIRPCASAFVKFYSLTGSKLPDLEVQNDLNRNPETSEHFSEIRRAEEKISLFSGSSLSVTSSLSNEANTNLIAHNDSGKINLYNSNYP